MCLASGLCHYTPCRGADTCPARVRWLAILLLTPHTQVIAISHHREFHEVADHIVRLHAADGRTVATYDR